jgi:hypothetical protein
LDRQLARRDLGQLDLHAWLRRVIDALREKRGLKLDEILVLKYRLLVSLKTRLEELHRASSAAGQELLFGGTLQDVEIRWNHSFSFDPQQPPYSKPEPLNGGGYQFAKHLYPMIQDLKRSGEEFDCAVAIGRSPAVKTWVRNIPLHPRSFWLPLATGRFFPDFVAQLVDGRVMVVEYKGGMLASADDAKEKRRVGELWERVSGGQGLFLWALKAGPQGRSCIGPNPGEDHMSEESTTSQTDKAEKACHFCGKPAEFARRLIAGEQVHICDECVGVCVGILDGLIKLAFWLPQKVPKNLYQPSPRLQYKPSWAINGSGTQR